MIWNAVGTTFYFGCQWLLTVLVVRFSGGYGDAGVLSLAMSISNPLLVVACLNLRTFQISELESRFSDGDFLMNRILASVISVVLCVFVITFGGYGKYKSICTIAFMVFKLSEMLADVLHGIDQKAWRLDIAGKSYILRGCATLLAMIFGALFGGNLIWTILCMTLFAYLIIFFYDYRICKKQLHPNFSYVWLNVASLTKIGIPLALYSFFLTLISSYPRFQVEEQYGKELLGIYSSIATPTVLVTQLASFIFSPLMGIFAMCRQKRDRKRLYKLLLISIGGTIIIGILSSVAGKVLGERALVLLFGESIREYAYLLVPVICTAVLTAAVWLFCGLLTVFKDYYTLAAITFISMVVCIVSSAPFIAKKQLLGAVSALALALAVEVFLLLLRFMLLLKRERLLSCGVLY